MSGGGQASGPLSFMRGFDAFAGVIKSGGKTRRAAKMVILNVDHPDIMDFIDCKAKEEAKAFTLIKAGYDGSGPDSEAYSSIFFQNANNSVRVSDEFMRAYESDGDFTTYTVKGHEPVETYKARDIMHKIAEATWLCGDPGHAVRHHHQPVAHEQEHGAHQRVESLLGVHVPGQLGLQPGQLQPDEVCQRRRASSTFAAYRHAISVVITAMEILVDNSGLSDRGDRAELARLPAAGAGLRQPGRAADGLWAAVRLGGRTRPGGEPDGDHVRPGLSAVGGDCGQLPAACFGHAADGFGGARRAARAPASM